ncbi:MAG: ribosomal-protein-alanine N-acetyltransferase, partial [Cellvibrionaceae bacterium]
PILYTSRLVLDELRDDDHEAIYHIFSDKKAMALYDMERLTKPEEGLDIINFLRNKFTTNSGIRWAIREISPSRQSSKLIGTCGFNNWVAYDHSAIIGYELAPEFWCKGYATEAIHKIISAAYNDELQIHVNRIEASVVPGNIASEKVLKKNGFIFEGRLREKAFWDNQYQDMNLFALIKSHFLKA